MVYDVPAEESCCSPAVCCTEANNEKHYPRVTIPASRKMVEGLQAGAKISVTLTGDVQALRIVEGGHDWDRTEFCLELTKVQTTDGEFDKLAKAYEED